ncbi:transcription cofactor vestigial-like protein 4 isoform X10 [Bubalus bubalis]|uniref:transcription cofactor vestigial-like protein 4 isoform X10 n=1 Tax=Bubalus bubalis TaxID=89462 RepID=UPI001E1B93A8|nr:transcription cofactor vestigial-like protein 4 isoform X10 [Bubalus bubalis]
MTKWKPTFLILNLFLEFEVLRAYVNSCAAGVPRILWHCCQIHLPHSAQPTWLQPGMETPLDVLSRAASLVHADDEKRPWLQHAGASIFAVTRGLQLQHVNSYCLTWDPVPRPGIEPQPPSFGAWSLSHWTTGEVPRSHLLKGEAALRGEPRLQTLPVASALTAHRTGPPPISPSKRKFSVDPGDDDLDCDGDHASKMSRIFAPHLCFLWFDRGTVYSKVHTPEICSVMDTVAIDSDSVGAGFGRPLLHHFWVEDVFFPGTQMPSSSSSHHLLPL